MIDTRMQATQTTAKVDYAIMKFGGSCLTSPTAFQRILEIYQEIKAPQKIFVVSALSGITDQLFSLIEDAKPLPSKMVFNSAIEQKLSGIRQQHLDIINALFPKPSPFYKDACAFLDTITSTIENSLVEIVDFGLAPNFIAKIIGLGEKLSAKILALFLNANEIRTQCLFTDDMIVTDNNYLNANPDLKLSLKRIQRHIMDSLNSNSEETVFTVTGFIGRSKNGHITTLGRGGSDFTATILAKALRIITPDVQVEVTYWKDVDGLLTGNPHHVHTPRLIEHINYVEAKELANFGAEILHPKCLAMIEEEKIPIKICKFTSASLDQYTQIGPYAYNEKFVGISSIKDMCMISISSEEFVDVPGTLARMFTILGEHNINIRIISQSSSEINTTILVDRTEGDRAVALLNQNLAFQDFFSFSQKTVGVIAVIGQWVNNSYWLTQIYSELHRWHINPIVVTQGSDGLNLTLVIPSSQVELAANSLTDLLIN